MLPELQLIAKRVIPARPEHQIKIETNWFVFYTYPRAEKVVCKELEKRDYEVFLPVSKVLKVWKNRQKKWIEEVLFPGYIFVNTQHCEIFNINRVPKVVTCIQCDRKPSIIPAKEINGIKDMLSLNQIISVETKFYEGERVRIIYGPLSGHEGILVQQKGKTRFGIQLREINHTVFIDISTAVIEKIG
jgi:transcription antitermination factor NusG